jgi:hypothetical protein
VENASNGLRVVDTLRPGHVSGNTDAGKRLGSAGSALPSHPAAATSLTAGLALQVFVGTNRITSEKAVAATLLDRFPVQGGLFPQAMFAAVRIAPKMSETRPGLALRAIPQPGGTIVRSRKEQYVMKIDYFRRTRLTNDHLTNLHPGGNPSYVRYLHRNLKY